MIAWNIEENRDRLDWLENQRRKHTARGQAAITWFAWGFVILAVPTVLAVVVVVRGFRLLGRLVGG